MKFVAEIVNYLNKVPTSSPCEINLFIICVSVVDALLVIGLPDGPTAHFKLSNLVLRKDIKVLLLIYSPYYLHLNYQSGHLLCVKVVLSCCL